MVYFSFRADSHSSEWRLFIDCSKLSLNAVLLHNGNAYPPMPFVQSVHMKESYENIHQLVKFTELQKPQMAYMWRFKSDRTSTSNADKLHREWNSHDKPNHFVNTGLKGAILC